MNEAKKAMREGVDPRIVIRAVELAVAEADDRLERRARKLIDYRATLLDLSDEILKSAARGP